MPRFLLSFLRVLVIVGACAMWCSFAPSVAHAGLDACGNIHVEAEAYCEISGPEFDCEAACEPINLEASCAAELTAECRGGCEGSATVDCDFEGCQAGCEGRCEVDPGKFDCSAECRAECAGGCEVDCSGHCEGKCEASEDSASCEGECRAECKASCEGNCAASCDASCDVELPEADCEGRCEASCEGKCEAESTFECQVDCQAGGFVDCEAELQGGCEAECTSEEGALFCDGQYIDHGDNLKECTAALRAMFDIEAYAEGEAGCEGGVCEARGEAGVSCECATVPGGKRNPSWPVFAGLLALCLAFARRRMGHSRP